MNRILKVLSPVLVFSLMTCFPTISALADMSNDKKTEEQVERIEKNVNLEQEKTNKVRERAEEKAAKEKDKKKAEEILDRADAQVERMEKKTQIEREKANKAQERAKEKEKK